jgi:hypothetical protein
VTPGDATDGVAQLENLGGQDASVHLEVGPPFQLRSQTAIVPANGTVNIPVRLPAVEAGLHRATLTARADGQMARTDISAEVPQGPTAPVPETRVAPPPREVPATEPAQVAPEEKTFYPATLKEFPNGFGNFAKEIQPTSAVIDWPITLGGIAGPRIEERTLSLAPDGGLEIDWARFDSVRFFQTGDRMRAELTDLQPASLHTMRVVTDRGGMPEVIFTAQFRTPAEKPSFEVNWRAIALVAAVAAFVFLLWKRRKAGSGW